VKKRRKAKRRTMPSPLSCSFSPPPFAVIAALPFPSLRDGKGEASLVQELSL